MSRLAYDHDGVTIAVAFDRYTFADRSAWHWSIRETDGPVMAEASDLETAEYDMVGALISLHGFLDAWTESREHWERTGSAGENADLFPVALYERLDWRGWLDYAHSDLHPGEWRS